MKKTITTTAFICGYFFLMVSLGVIAATPANNGQKQKNAKESVRREIIRNIACPEFISDNSEINEVKAIVQVDESGAISIQEINSGNTRLKDYVAAQLQGMKLQTTGAAEKFILIIKFKIA